MLVELDLRDGFHVNLVRSVGEAERPDIRLGCCELEITGNAAGPVDLNGLIEDAERHRRSDHLDGRNVRLGDLVADARLGMIEHGMGACVIRHKQKQQRDC